MSCCFISIPKKIKTFVKYMPDKTCIEFTNKTISYIELDQKSDNAAANIIRAIGSLGHKRPIAILIDHSPEVYYIEIGAMKLGIPFLSLSSDYPRERLRFCIKDSDCCLLITTEDKISDYSEDLGIKVCTASSLTEDKPHGKIETNINPTTPTLVIYTSGSTGKPKGMVHTHQALLDLIEGDRPDYPISLLTQKFTNMMAMTRISFIASLFNYMALYNGATTQIPSEKEFTDYRALLSRIKEKNITAFFCTPSFLSNLLEDKSGKEIIKIIKVLLIGGEKNRKPLMDRIFSLNSDVTLINCYGCSETCGPCISAILNRDSSEYLVGKPILGTEVIIVDTEKKQVQKGEKGQVVILSSRVIENYLGHALGSISFEKINGEKAFFTGDLGMIAQDNNLYVYDRNDDMIKYHGQRIELGDIESTAEKFPDMGICKALLLNNGKDDFLCLSFQSHKTIETKELKLFISSQLPGYMVPGMFYQIDKMPLTVSGKIDRMKLTEQISNLKRTIDLPETKTEKIITEVFSEALGYDEFGVNDDFYQMGGNSLALATVVTKLGEKGFEVSYTNIYSNSTPRELAKFIDSQSDKKFDLKMDKDKYPLTKTQYGVYLEVKLGICPETYSIPYIMQASEDIDENMLVHAVRTVIDAHPGMKYVIREYKDKPFMYFDPQMKFDIPVYQGKAKDRLDFIKQFKPITSLENQPLFHFAVYKAETCCYLMMKTHMIFQDATSTTVLIRDLNCVLRAEKPQKEKHTIQQEGLYDEQKILLGYHKESQKYFRNLFSSMAEAVNLKGDLNNPLTPGISMNQTYNETVLTTNEVRQTCEKLHISESSFFSASLGLLLGKYLFKNKIAFSFVFNGRTRADLSNSVGTYIKRLPLYCNLEEDASCRDFLQSINSQMINSMAHDSYSFDEALKELPVNEDVEFLFQGKTFTDDINKSPTNNKIKGDSFFVENYHTGMITGCLSIALFSSNDSYSLHVEYRNERFSKHWVEDFSRRFFMIAKALLTEKQISDISILSDKDQKLIQDSNNTSIEIPFIPIHKIIHEFALKNPNKLAVISTNRKITYRELDEQSNSICSNLRALKVSKGDFVAVYLDREVNIYPAEIGILKAGCCFVPFAFNCPFEHLSLCIDDASIKVVITEEKQLKIIPEVLKNKCKFVSIESLLQKANLPNVTNCQETDLAYVIYTSGSTGKQKGVMIEHKAFSNYVSRNNKSIEIIHYGEQSRVCLALASFAFDVSIVEAYVPLCNGATICLATEEEIHDPLLLADLIKKYKVDTMTATPTFLQYIIAIDVIKDALSQITLFDIGAEAFIPKLYEKLRNINKNSVILNVYGPTECTMGCTAALIHNSDDISIGKPNANTQVYVADTFLNPLPPGVIGELVITGTQVARGYINNKKQEQAVFFVRNGKKQYRSGDIACWTDNGNIQIYGRIDNQVKLHGFRIELDEITSKINNFEGVSNSATIIRDYKNSPVIVSYYTSDKEIDEQQLKSYLKQNLPHYMIPSFIVNVESLPMINNGKIETKKLASIKLPEKETEKITPKTKNEILLCKAFAKALSLQEKDIGINDDFFNLGGNSLNALVVVVEAKELGITVADIYSQRTIKDILQNSSHEKMLSIQEIQSINEQAKKDSVEITPFQIRFIDIALTNLKTNNLLVKGLNKMNLSVDPVRLCNAVNKTIHHLAIFGSKIMFNLDDGKFYMKYYPEEIKDVSVEYITEEQLQKIKPTLVKPFVIVGHFLYNIRIFKTETNVYLFICIHHILFDGGGLEPLNRNIYLAYNNMELIPDYYYFYLSDIVRKMNSSFAYQAREYYKTLTSDCVWNYSPKSDVKNQSFEHGVVFVPIKITLSQLRKMEKSLNCTANIISIMVSALAIAKEENYDNILLQWVYNNRLDILRKDIVGELSNLQPVFLQLKSLKNYSEIVREISKQMAKNIMYGDYYYEYNTHVPFYNECVLINYLGTMLEKNLSDITFHGNIESMSNNVDFPLLNFGINFLENTKTLDCFIYYNKAFFSADKVERISAYIRDEFELLYK